MNEESYYDEAIRYLAEDMSKEERAEFEQFLEGDPLRNEELEVLRKLWKNTSVYDSDAPSTDVDVQWQRFSDEAFSNGGKVIGISPWWKRLSRIAAIILLAATTVFTWRLVQRPVAQQSHEMLVSVDEGQKMVLLPDGSKVWLNENSEIRYDSHFEQRIVSLVGEGYFEVQHLESDAPFQVIAGKAQTTVLGTAFNIRAYPTEENVSVDVLEGKVAFQELSAIEKVILEKGQGAAYMNLDRSIKHKASTHFNAVAWKTGDLKFEDAELSQILRDLQRVYGAEFEVRDQVVLDCTFKSDFTDEKLEDVLDEIKFALKLTIDKHPANGIWIISGSGCAVEQ